MKKRIWVTGAGGLIGSNVLRFAQAEAGDWEWFGLGRSELDLLDHDRMRSEFAQQAPVALVHCAAIANTGHCEENPELAFRTNSEATRVLSELFSELPMVFLSTDIVFDGLSGGYVEESECRPINVYGRTKLDAETYVLRYPNHCVLRLSLNGGVSPSGDRGFNEVLKQTFNRGEELKLFVDEYRQPLPVEVTARVIMTALRERWSGIYHLGGAERMSRFAIGELLAAHWGIAKPNLSPSSLKDFSGGIRAPDTSMDCRKIQSRLDFEIPSLRDWLKDHPEASF